MVSYDAPVDMRKYVHRVGRTARAGRAGDAWTLVEEQEVSQAHLRRCRSIWADDNTTSASQARYFKIMLKASDHLDKVARLRVSSSQIAPLRPAYEVSLGIGSSSGLRLLSNALECLAKIEGDIHADFLAVIRPL